MEGNRIPIRNYTNLYDILFGLINMNGGDEVPNFRMVQIMYHM